MLSQIEIHVIEKIKELRVQNQMSQAEFAFILDVSARFIGKVESSKMNSKYNLIHINKIANHFNVSPRIFLPEKAFE